VDKKVYISADIEGTAGACNWTLEDRANEEYQRQRNILKREILAAVDEINKVVPGCQITVNDAHNTGCNYDVMDFPDNCEIIRGWDDGPLCMMQELNDSYDYVILLGYHSYAGSDFSPLAHTFASRRYAKVSLNGAIMSEFLINYYIASMLKVPVIMISGDQGICKEALRYDEKIKTAEIQVGRGGSVISVSEKKAEKLIRKAVREALSDEYEQITGLPDYFIMEITYFSHAEAYRRSYYPGCKRIDTNTVRFESDDFNEVLRALIFL